MLDRLPPEILDAILVLTYPPSPWQGNDDADRDRRQTLARLSLVRKAVRTRAQRLLWRKVVLTSSGAVGPFKHAAEANPALSSHIRTMRVLGGDPLQGVLPMLSVSGKVKKLQTLGNSVDWVDVASLPLTTLELSYAQVFASSPIQPSTLVRLSLPFICLQESLAPLIFTSTHLPHLQALEVGSFADMSRFAQHYYPPIHPDLAGQLDVLVVQTDGAELPLPDLLALPVTTLVTAKPSPTLPSLLRLRPRHLRLLDAVRFPSVNTPFAHLSELVHSDQTPQTLQLPRYLRLYDPPALAALLEVCAAKGVEVTWHEDQETGLSFLKAGEALAKRLRAETGREGPSLGEAGKVEQAV